jgi:Tfp pilus assembly protein PilN
MSTNVIDLLPDSFIQERRRRRLRAIQIVAASAAMVVAIAWAGLAYRQFSALGQQIRQAESEANAARLEAQALSMTKVETARLQGILSRREALELPAPASAVMALVAQLLPESVVLTRASMDVPRPVLEQAAAASPRRSRRASSSAPQAPESIKMELEGVAVSDQDVARLVGDLSAHGLFSNVKLAKSRQMTVAGNARYGFEVALELTPGVRYAPAETQREER